MNVRNAIDRALMGSRWINRSFERHHNEGHELHLRHLRAMAVNLIANIDELILAEEALHAHDREAELVQTIKNLKADYDRAKIDFDAALRAWQADETGYNELHTQSDRVARAFAALERARSEYSKLRWEE